MLVLKTTDCFLFLFINYFNRGFTRMWYRQKSYLWVKCNISKICNGVDLGVGRHLAPPTSILPLYKYKLLMKNCLRFLV